MLPFSSEIKIKAIDYVIDGAYKYTQRDTQFPHWLWMTGIIEDSEEKEFCPGCGGRRRCAAHSFSL